VPATGNAFSLNITISVYGSKNKAERARPETSLKAEARISHTGSKAAKKVGTTRQDGKRAVTRAKKKDRQR
jgi:hypothetical protein